MANPVWPVTLPQLPEVEGFNEKPGDSTLATKMDAGKKKRRRRYTAVVDEFSFNLTLTAAQKSDLKTFYRTTTFGGSIPFDWVDFETGGGAVYEFSEPPTYTPTGGLDWVAAIKLERLAS